MPKQMFVAVQSGSSEVAGETRIFVRGQTLVAEGDPLLKQLPGDYFKPADEDAFESAVISHTEETTETKRPPAARSRTRTPRKPRSSTTPRTRRPKKAGS